MNDIKALIENEIKDREAQIHGFEAAIEEARGFVFRLRQALAVLNGDAAVVGEQPAVASATASVTKPEEEAPSEPLAREQTHSAQNAPGKAREAASSGSSATAPRKEHDRSPEANCGCGRPAGHPGRCAFRRARKSASDPPASSRSEASREAPPPLRAKNTVEIQKQIVDGPISPTLCSGCGGPKGRSPYAVCRSCMGPESMKAEKNISPAQPPSMGA